MGPSTAPPPPVNQRRPTLPVTQIVQQALQYHQQGELLQAERGYRLVLQWQPDHAEALHGLAVLMSQQGELALGISLLRQAMAVEPRCARYHNNLGNLLVQHGDMDTALHAYQTAIGLQPDFAPAHYNLGTVLQARGDIPGAVAAYQAALRLQPEYVGAHNNLGLIRQAQGEAVAAQIHFETVLRLQPKLAAAHNNLGLVLQDQRQFAAALTAYRTALQLHPAYVEAWSNLGTAFYELGQYDAAMTAYNEALQWQPEYPQARWNQATVWLSTGDLRRGWPAYEWRLRTSPALAPSLPVPQWDGSPLQGRTLLVWAEQGVGDEILFASCVPELIQQAGHVILHCDLRLAPLFARSFSSVTLLTTPRGEPLPLADLPHLDVHSPLGSLPGILRSTLGHFPLRPGYLRVDELRRAQWQARLNALAPGLKVGLAWRSLVSRRQALYYTKLAQWQAVLRVPGIQWVNLQYDDYAAELTAVAQEWGIHIHHWPDLDTFLDLDGVAALMATIDLVIAPDTTVAQLAAALGVPVWRLTVNTASEMGLGTGVSPWSPTLRNYSQPQEGDWDSVLARLAADLHTLQHYGPRYPATGALAMPASNAPWVRENHA